MSFIHVLLANRAVSVAGRRKVKQTVLTTSNSQTIRKNITIQRFKYK